jgi:hypothetical protein
MHDQEEEGILRENAQVQLAILDSLDRADHLTGLVAEFEQRFGRRPERVQELQRAGLWGGPLTDLKGVPFSYDVSTGQVSISQDSRLWRPR